MHGEVCINGTEQSLVNRAPIHSLGYKCDWPVRNYTMKQDLLHFASRQAGAMPWVEFD